MSDSTQQRTRSQGPAYRTLRLHCVLSLGCLTGLLAPWGGYADLVVDWNALLLDSVRADLTGPPQAARNLAILHTSIYDAINAIDQRHSPYRVQLSAPDNALPEAVALGAAHQVLTTLYPSRQAVFDGSLSANLAMLPSNSRLYESDLAFGRSVANGILTWRATDGSSLFQNYVPGSEPGAWRRTAPDYRPPLTPQWPYVTPFAISNVSGFRPPGPPSLDSSQYAVEHNQVRQLGAANSSTRTAEQTEIALFWSDYFYTATPPGHWNQIAQTVSESQGNSLTDNARMFALLNVALADAGIVAWDAKYEYNFWRPVTAIQEAHRDGNPGTIADPDWEPLLTNPAFPEYVSGHSTFSGAAAAVLAEFFGADEIAFEIGSDGMPGVVRSFDSFSEAAEESGLSRIYGGIHFLSSDLDGLEAGEAVGRYVFANYFQPVPEPTVVVLCSTGFVILLTRRVWSAKRPAQVAQPRGTPGAAFTCRL